MGVDHQYGKDMTPDELKGVIIEYFAAAKEFTDSEPTFQIKGMLSQLWLLMNTIAMQMTELTRHESSSKEYNLSMALLSESTKDMRNKLADCRKIIKEDPRNAIYQGQVDAVRKALQIAERLL